MSSRVKRTAGAPMSLDKSLASSLNVKPWFKKTVILQNAWEDVATDAVLAHTDNVIYDKKLGQKVVVIFVDGAQWAAQLGMDKEFYRISLGHTLGWELDEVRFTVSRQTGIRKEFKKVEEKNQKGEFADIESIPLTEEEEKLVRLSLEDIDDNKLKEKVFNAMKADIEWKKGIKASKTSQN